jgi:hypothetical protein
MKPLWLLPAVALAAMPATAQIRTGPIEGAPVIEIPAGIVSPTFDAGASAGAQGVDHQSLTPLELVLLEHPAVEKELEARIAASPYAAELSGRWKPAASRALEPFLESVARRRAWTPARYTAFLASREQGAAEERASLARMLSENTSHPTEAATALLRDHPIWKAPLEAYLAKLIASRKEEKTLSLQSVGAAYGVEAYGLAVVADRVLRQSGEDPSKWDVRIDAYDKSLVSLLAAGQGLLKLDSADADVFAENDLEQAFHPEHAPSAEGHPFREPGQASPSPEGLLRLRPDLRRWIRPVYADLDQEAQHSIVTGARPDVVFANYTLYHLRLEPAAALANHWLRGRWNDAGFLSLAHVVLAEIGAAPRKAGEMTKVGLLRRFEANVGAHGRGYYADSFRALGGFVRQAWLKLTNSATRSALRAGEAFASELSSDPFASMKVDADALSVLTEAAKLVRVVVTTQEIAFKFDTESGLMHVNAGWLAPGADRSVLSAFVESILQTLRGRAMRPGLTGRTLEGAELRIDDGRLFWLDERLAPITDDYRSHNAARGAKSKGRSPAGGGENAVPRSGTARPASSMVRGLN